MELKHAVSNVLNQLSGLIKDIGEENFAKPVPALNNSTLGQHIRHTLEFFICLMDGYATGSVDYDKRRHDKNIEEDPKIAISVIEKIIYFLDRNPNDKAFKLAACYSTENDISEEVTTTYYRELVYNIEHAIHHMAILKIGVKELCPEVTLPEGFGVAVSTIKYQKQQTAN